MIAESIKKQFKPGYRIEKPSRVVKSSGSTTTTYAEQTYTINGIIVKARSSGTLILVTGQLQTRDAFTMYCGPHEDIKPTDRIIDHDGLKYEVQAAQDPQKRGYFLKVELEVCPNEIQQ